ncbi:MAG: hypothetical protein AB1782_00165 [Cyanobacteriota bacterium]
MRVNDFSFASTIKSNKNHCKNNLNPGLKTIQKDTITFGTTKAVSLENKYIDPSEISGLSEDFTKGISALQRVDKLNLENVKTLINKLLPDKKVTVKSIDQIREVSGLETVPKEIAKNIYGVFNPVFDRSTGELKFELYLNLSDSEKAEVKDTKCIARVHEFVHLLQANTKRNFELTRNALMCPEQAYQSYPKLSNIFHAIEQELYFNSNRPQEKYPEMIKGYVDPYYAKSDSIDVYKFVMVNAFNESQAHFESLKSLLKVLKPENLTETSPFKVVYGTIPVYMNLAEGALKILNDDMKSILKDRDKDVVDFYYSVHKMFDR